MSDVKLKTADCPRCGASIDISTARNNRLICGYCGNTFVIDNDEDIKEDLEELEKEVNLLKQQLKSVSKNSNSEKQLLLKLQQHQTLLAQSKRYGGEQSYKIYPVQQPRKKSNAATGIIIGSFVFMIMSGAISIFMAVGTSTNVHKNMPSSTRKSKQLALQRQRQYKIKEWKNIIGKYLTPVKQSKIKDIRKTLKDLGIPSYGSKNPEISIYEFYPALSYWNGKKILKKKNELTARFHNVSWSIIPISKQWRKHRKFFNVMFEILLQRSADGYDDFISKITKSSTFVMYPKKLTKRLKCDVKALKLAMRKNFHKEKIEKLKKLTEHYDLDEPGGVTLIFFNKHNKTYQLSHSGRYYFNQIMQNVTDPEMLKFLIK